MARINEHPYYDEKWPEMHEKEARAARNPKLRGQLAQLAKLVYEERGSEFGDIYKKRFGFSENENLNKYPTLPGTGIDRFLDKGNVIEKHHNYPSDEQEALQWDREVPAYNMAKDMYVYGTHGRGGRSKASEVAFNKLRSEVREDVANDKINALRKVLGIEPSDATKKMYK